MLNLYPQKGRIEEGSDADIVVWNPNNLRTVSIKETSESRADVNVFEGLSVHGAPEYVVANGRVVVYEYEINPNVNHVGAKILEAEAFPSVLYDQVQDLDDLGKIVAVEREVQEDSTDSGAPQSEDFGLTTPRKSSEPPVLNKRLGIYQRPMSAHGVRNQQDSTFSLAGGYGHDGGIGSPKRAVKINAPPGGSSMAFW